MYCNCSSNYHFVSAVLIGIQIAMGEMSPIFFLNDTLGCKKY